MESAPTYTRQEAMDKLNITLIHFEGMLDRGELSPVPGTEGEKFLKSDVDKIHVEPDFQRGGRYDVTSEAAFDSCR